MSRQWTRQHDAHIASHVEGLEVVMLYPDGYCTQDPLGFTPHGGKTQDTFTPIPRYNTDLTAAFRALEAWRVKDSATRSYLIKCPMPNLEGWVSTLEYKSFTCSRPVNVDWSTLADLPQAIAWAVYDASGGAE